MTTGAACMGRDVAAPWLTARGISKHYGGVKALIRADLDLRAGEFHGLVGPNGAGKSTLVSILSGAVDPDSGSILVDGEEVRIHDPADGIRHHVVLMPQKLAVVLDASVADNITLGREPSRYALWSPRASRERAEAALDVVGLHLDPRDRVSSLSAVQKRLVMLARAIDQHPRLLILDEPTAGLPPHEASLVISTVQEFMSHSGTSVLFVSHDLSEVAEASDVVTGIREGVVAATLHGDSVTKDALVGLVLGVTSEPTPVSVEPTDLHRRSNGDSKVSVEVVNVQGEVLAGVTAGFPSNRVTGVAGLLGSGDDELVSFLVGAKTPAGGTIRIGGESRLFRSPADALQTGVCYLAGERTITTFPALSIRENVSVSALWKWFGRLGLIVRSREQNLVSQPLATLSVDADTRRSLATLSGGNQQRALIGRLIAADAPIIVIKEPTIGVDIRARQELWDAVKGLAAGRTVVIASSEPEELLAMCDRVLCIRRGHLVAELEGTHLTKHAITAAIS